MKKVLTRRCPHGCYQVDRVLVDRQGCYCVFENTEIFCVTSHLDKRDLWERYLYGGTFYLYLDVKTIGTAWNSTIQVCNDDLRRPIVVVEVDTWTEKINVTPNNRPLEAEAARRNLNVISSFDCHCQRVRYEVIISIGSYVPRNLPGGGESIYSNESWCST